MVSFFVQHLSNLEDLPRCLFRLSNFSVQYFAFIKVLTLEFRPTSIVETILKVVWSVLDNELVTLNFY